MQKNQMKMRIDEKNTEASVEAGSSAKYGSLEVVNIRLVKEPSILSSNRKCTNLKELKIVLKSMGYECRFDPGRKYWTIRQRDWQRPIRLNSTYFYVRSLLCCK